MDWFFSVFRRKSNVASEKALMDDKDKEVLREYEVLTSLQERAEQVLKLAKESPDSATRSELLNMSASISPVPHTGTNLFSHLQQQRHLEVGLG